MDFIAETLRSSVTGLLLQFEGSLVCQTLAGPREGPIKGEAYLYIRAVSAETAVLALGRLHVVSAGLNAGEQGQSSGKLSVQALPAVGQAAPQGERFWRLSIPFEAAVYYEEIGRQRGFLRRGHTFWPRFERFTGTLEGRFGSSPGAAGIDFTSGRLRLRYQSEGLAWLRSMALSIPRIRAAPLASPLPDGCTVGHEASPQTVKIRPIGFRPEVDQDGPPTGSSAGDQIADAASIWKKCCIELVRLDLVSLPRGDLMVSDNPRLVAAAVKADPDPQVVEVIFVRNPLTQFGGGATVAAGTNAVKIVLSEDATGHGQTNLLAHELGHALAGMHPGERPTIHFWTGQQGTVLQPSSTAFPDIPGRNTMANCQSARNPVIVTRPMGCCRAPDERR